MPAAGTDVEDAPVAGIHHYGHNSLAHHVLAREIDCDDPLPIVKLNLPQRNLLGGRPGVVDENVQSSKAVTSGFHGSLGERRIGDIAGQSYGFASRGPKGLCYRFCGVQM
jgi:hypothetical protein